jgi:pilus assembly protein CpaF
VTGRVEGDVIETETLFERRDGRLACTGGRPPRREAFARAGLDLDALLGERG